MLDSVKHVEQDFSNLDFLQDLPDMVQFPSEEISEPQISPEPEIPTEEFQSIKKQDETQAKQPEKPEKIQQKQPTPLNPLQKKSSIQHYFHNRIAKPLIGPPAPGHTTFTIQLNDSNVTGFYQMPTDTRSLKELGPVALTKTKTLLKTIKERDFKKDVKNIKNLPKTLKKTVSNLKLDSLKTLPKKLRTLFSSD